MDLNEIDFKNAGSLPWTIQLAMLVGIVIILILAGGWFVWKPMVDDFEAAVIQERGPDNVSGLRGVYEQKVALAANLDAYKAQLDQVEKKSDLLLRKLPNKSEMAGLLTDINQAGIGRGLEFDLFKPGDERANDLYVEMPINIRVTGNYHELGAFASDVAMMPRIVRLANITITKSTVKKGDGGSVQNKLVMNAIAETFRSLDGQDMEEAQ